MTTRGYRQLPSGRFLVRAQYKKGRVAEVVATEAEAIDLRAALEHRFASGAVVPVAGSSLKLLGGAFLKSLKGRDVRNPRSRWQNHVINAPFVARHIATIAAADVLDWIDSIEGSWQTRKHVLNLLRAFFTWALRRRIVTSNPCVGLRLERADGDEEEGWQPTWYLDPEEQAALIAAIDDDEARRMTIIALGTGLRLGELLCLHVVDVHDAHVDVLYGSWEPKTARYRPPKGKSGSKRTRQVALFGAARQAMAVQLAELEQRKRELPADAKYLARRRAENPLGLVFASRWGGRRTKPPQAFSEAAKVLAVPRLAGKRIWWHLLRHTCATSLCTGWWGRAWDLREVQQNMGHSSRTTTELYAHLVSGAIQSSSHEAHEAWNLGGNAAVMAELSENAELPEFVGRSPKDSNLQPAASKADALSN